MKSPPSKSDNGKLLQPGQAVNAVTKFSDAVLEDAHLVISIHERKIDHQDRESISDAMQRLRTSLGNLLRLAEKFDAKPEMRDWEYNAFRMNMAGSRQAAVIWLNSIHMRLGVPTINDDKQTKLTIHRDEDSEVA